ncbi:MAG: hypothetical protein U0169_16265 [Polyangiaceae bacterium]
MTRETHANTPRRSPFGDATPAFLGASLVGAVVVRLVCMLVITIRHDVGDEKGYIDAGLAIARHATYSAETSAPYLPTAYRPPGYSAFVGGVFAVFGDHVGAVQVAQILLGLATLLLGVAIAAKVRPGSERFACVLLALNPFDAIYSVVFLSEGLASFLMMASAAAFTLLTGARRVVLGAMLLGLLCLVRDIYMAMVLLGAATFVVTRGAGTLKASLRLASLVVVVTALVIAPWTARNRAHFGKTIPVSAGRLGFSLWMGTWARNGDFTMGDAVGARVYPPEAYANESERALVAEAAKDVGAAEPIFKRLFVERVKAKPGEVVTTWLVRLPKLWFGTRFDIFEFRNDWFPRGSPQWIVVKVLLLATNSILVLLAAAGTAFLLWKRQPAAWLSFPLAFTTAAYLPLNSFENRYSQPTLAFVMILAAIALHVAVGLVRARGTKLGASPATVTG